MRTVIELARQCQRFNVQWGDRESRKISLLDDITVAGTLRDAQCVQQ